MVVWSFVLYVLLMLHAGFCCWTYVEHLVSRLGTQRTQLHWLLEGQSMGGLDLSWSSRICFMKWNFSLSQITHCGILQFFAGVLFFGFVVKFIPEPTFVPTTDASKKKVGMNNPRGCFQHHSYQICFLTKISWLNRSWFSFVESRLMMTGQAKIWWKNIAGKSYSVASLLLLVSYCLCFYILSIFALTEVKHSSQSFDFVLILSCRN